MGDTGDLSVVGGVVTGVGLNTGDRGDPLLSLGVTGLLIAFRVSSSMRFLFSSSILCLAANSSCCLRTIS